MTRPLTINPAASEIAALKTAARAKPSTNAEATSGAAPFELHLSEERPQIDTAVDADRDPSAPNTQSTGTEDIVSNSAGSANEIVDLSHVKNDFTGNTHSPAAWFGGSTPEPVHGLALEQTPGPVANAGLPGSPAQPQSHDPAPRIPASPAPNTDLAPAGQGEPAAGPAPSDNPHDAANPPIVPKPAVDGAPVADAALPGPAGRTASVTPIAPVAPIAPANPADPAVPAAGTANAGQSERTSPVVTGSMPVDKSVRAVPIPAAAPASPAMPAVPTTTTPGHTSPDPAGQTSFSDLADTETAAATTNTAARAGVGKPADQSERSVAAERAVPARPAIPADPATEARPATPAEPATPARPAIPARPADTARPDTPVHRGPSAQGLLKGKAIGRSPGLVPGQNPLSSASTPPTPVQQPVVTGTLGDAQQTAVKEETLTTPPLTSATTGDETTKTSAGAKPGSASQSATPPAKVATGGAPAEILPLDANRTNVAQPAAVQPGEAIVIQPQNDGSSGFTLRVTGTANAPQSLQIPAAAFALQIARQASRGESRFEIRLDPPELGRIDVKLQIAADGRVNAHMTVERVETLDLLQRDARSLERALSEAGLKTGDSALSFSLRDQGSANLARDGGTDPSGRSPANDEETGEENADGMQTVLSGHIRADSVDIRV